MLRINGVESPFASEDWVLLPWRHEIVYNADAKTPFFVGGIHIIPSHSNRIPVVFQVAHSRTANPTTQTGRDNALWPGMDKVVHGRFAGRDDRVSLLAAYIVENFQHDRPERGPMSHLATLLISELSRAVNAKQPGTKPRPATLLRMQEYARSHLDRIFTVQDLASLAKCSTASVHRQFQACESLSPGRWIARLRAERAAKLLRTTSLSVQDVGAQVGLTDPFHFSRFFKREMGVPPRTYHGNHHFL